MDKQPKRRVLSLSLSQPGKQNRKHKLKRHASATSENASKILPCEDWQEVNNTRTSVEMNVSEDTTNLITSKISEQQAIKPLFCDKNETSFTPIFTQQKKQSVSLKELEPEDSHEEKYVLVDTTGDNITTRRGKKATSSLIVGGNIKPSVSEEDYDHDFVKPLCSRKTTETIPLKHPSLNSVTHGTSTNKSSKNGEIETTSTCSRASSLATREAVSFDDKRSTQEQSGTTTCINSSSVDISVPDKSAGTNPALNDDDGCFEVLQCPLCCRIFDKITSKTSHLKSCASKHKVSTQQLLEALELQRRQATERKALGLPPISPSVEKVKKPSATKKGSRTTTKVDNNLQLAMALSLSLQDAEKVVQESSTSESNRGISLDHFGFTNKSVLNSIQPRTTTALGFKGKSKGTVKKTPALLTRTSEERQRIITEKVAMVLMEEVASGEDEVSKEIDVKSTFLQECVDEERALWVKSHTSPSKNDRTSYYVQSLRSFISPSKVEMGSKVMHLSQVVGRLNTPTKDKDKRQEKDELIPNSPTDEEMSSDSSCHQQNEFKDPAHIEMELRAKLFNDWASMVNNCTLSDLAIYPQEGRDIPTHKMVLHVRCPRILKDICRQRNPLTGNEVEVIMWSKTPHAAALAFLEYIYCGSVKSIRVLSEDLSSISWLAEHYKVADLMRYLQSVSESTPISQTSSQAALNVVKDSSEDCLKHVRESEKENLVPPLNEVCLRRLSKASTDMFASPAGTPTRSDTDSIYSEVTVQGVDNRSSCSSPDMFCDDETGQTMELSVKEHNIEKVIDSDNSERNSIAKTLFSNSSNGDRPPSRCASVSSERTVIVERISPPVSPCLSASSDKTVLINNISPPLSPAISNTSAATELLDLNQSSTSRPGSSLNDSKRKHSNSSQDGDSSSCKRPCTVNLTPEHQEGKDSDVEFCDLTQDSDSNTSFPVIQNNFSGNSCDNICVPLENEIILNSDEIQSPVHARKVSNDESNYNRSSELNEHDNSNEQIVEHEHVENAVSYVSPVWEGFEDLNYDDPFFNEPHTETDSPAKTTITPPKSDENAVLSTINDERFVSQSKSPGKTSFSSKNKNCDDVDSKDSSDCEVTFSSPTATVTLKPSMSSFDALLDDSLNINDSILQQAEKGITEKLTQRETKGTPVNRILSSEPDNVTPLANYSAMKTPELKKELQKFGLKPTLGKRKGKLMLRHIYNELHPWVPIGTNASLPDRISFSQPSCSSSTGNQTSSELNSRRLSFSDSDTVENKTTPFEKDSTNSGTDSDTESNYSSRSINTSLQEIQYLEGDDDVDDCETKSQAASKRVSKADLPRIVSNFIRNDRELHQKVLEYEPIRIEKLQADLLTKGFKCGIEALMTFLDEKCITFRSESSGPRVRKRKPKPAAQKKTAKNSETNDFDSD